MNVAEIARGKVVESAENKSGNKDSDSDDKKKISGKAFWKMLKAKKADER